MNSPKRSSKTHTKVSQQTDTHFLSINGGIFVPVVGREKSGFPSTQKQNHSPQHFTVFISYGLYPEDITVTKEVYLFNLGLVLLNKILNYIYHFLGSQIGKAGVSPVQAQ